MYVGSMKQYTALLRNVKYRSAVRREVHQESGTRTRRFVRPRPLPLGKTSRKKLKCEKNELAAVSRQRTACHLIYSWVLLILILTVCITCTTCDNLGPYTQTASEGKSIRIHRQVPYTGIIPVWYPERWWKGKAFAARWMIQVSISGGSSKKGITPSWGIQAALLLI